MTWVESWTNKVELGLDIELIQSLIRPEERYDFKVIDRTDVNADETFLIKLRPTKKVDFQSGDLLNVQFAPDEVHRQYSIAKIGKDIVLSVKRHEHGKCSLFMANKRLNDNVKASVQNNTKFRMSSEPNEVIMIANGTGIAPFLGMIMDDAVENKRLFWGCRNEESKEIYDSFGFDLNSVAEQVAQSRTDGKYVQDLFKGSPNLLSDCLESGGHVMICGSLAMQNDVLELMERQLTNKDLTLEHFRDSKQLRTDCY
jgi:sulfite reductase (NADPH) flavoprotein alpha-component